MTARSTGARLRPLNRPRPITVEAGENGLPAAVQISRNRVAVEQVLESWRIDDEWWRPQPISRLYHRLLLADGRIVDVYRDLVTGRWFQQAY